MPDEPQVTTPIEDPASLPPPEKREIPYSRFREVIDERNNLRGEIDALKQTYEQRWQELLKQIEAGKGPAPAKGDPSFDDDPAGYLRNQSDRLSKKLDDAIGALSRDQESAQYREQLQVALNSVSREESEFSKKQPDYFKSVDWYKEVRHSQLDDMGISKSEIERTLAADSQWFIQKARDLGESPAEYFYRYIKKLGWQPSGALSGKKLSEPPSSLAGTHKESISHGEVPEFAKISKLSNKDFTELFDRLMKK